jgi:hypothetical protein
MIKFKSIINVRMCRKIMIFKSSKYFWLVKDFSFNMSERRLQKRINVVCIFLWISISSIINHSIYSEVEWCILYRYKSSNTVFDVFSIHLFPLQICWFKNFTFYGIKLCFINVNRRLNFNIWSLYILSGTSGLKKK